MGFDEFFGDSPEFFKKSVKNSIKNILTKLGKPVIMIIINDEFLKEGKMEGQLKRIKEKFMTSIMPDRVLEKVIREHYPKWTDSQIKRTVKVFSSQRTKALEKSLKRRKHF